MKKRVFNVLFASCLVILMLSTPRSPVRAQNSGKTFTVDVACDARTYRQNNVDPSAAGSNRGDTFIVAGKIYPGGTIPQGNGSLAPTIPEALGSGSAAVRG